MSSSSSQSTACGKDAKRHFLFEPGWTNMNHGSFGASPLAIRAKLHQYQDQYESHPDQFIRYEYPILLDESRKAVANLLNAPEETVVFIPNATVGINTVFRNLSWNTAGTDVILSFSTIYEACAKAIDYIVDFTNGLVTHHEIPLTYPLEDEEIINKFRSTVQQLQASGQHVRACIYDVVSSRPGVPFPWVEMTQVCKKLGILSVVDGAQGIGMVPMDLSAVDPDFWVTNCHKWLHVPRACAVFFVPVRNQHLITTTLATSHGYVPKITKRGTPLPPSAKSPFVHNFEYVGTLDNSPYLCTKDAIEWRRQEFGGEEQIMEYLWSLNRAGSEIIAEILGTEYLENKAGTLRDCAMSNIALPIWICAQDQCGKKVDGESHAQSRTVMSTEEGVQAFQWLLQRMMEDHKTFIALFLHDGRLWARVSAQVYLDLEDYMWAGGVLKSLCERVARGEYRD